MFAFGVFIGLFCFAVHFMLQTVYESVLTDVVPELMNQSYFTVEYTYTIVAVIFFVVYFIVFYQYLTFAEIHKNRWYMLVKMGYDPLTMILAKLAARLYSVFFMYTLGFLVSVGLTAFLKYILVVEYLITLYLSGLFDILIIVFITMALSLYIRTETNARYVTAGSFLLIVLIKVTSGYYSIVSNRQMMTTVSNLFDFRKSLYLPVMGSVVLICLFACIFRAGSIAKYYTASRQQEENIEIQDFRTNKIKSRTVRQSGRAVKAINVVLNTALIIFVVLSLAVNVLVLAVSVATPQTEVAISGVIPYVFQSGTMEPAIMKNDLAFFNKIDVQYPINTGDVVLFKEDNTVYVERVLAKSGDTLTVDIDKYPPLSEKGSLKKDIQRPVVYGVYSSRNRWLGALILFLNSIFGRVLFLFIPSILIFFNKPIKKFLQTFSRLESQK